MNEATATPKEAAALRLRALDDEDLAVISAHLQDAEVRVGDIAYLHKMRRFALVAARFDWPLAKQGINQRCATGLHFESVRKVMRVGFEQDAERVLRLQAIVFLPAAAPSGIVLLSFAGGGAIRLDVECLEAALSDIGPRWDVGPMPNLPGA